MNWVDINFWVYSPAAITIAIFALTGAVLFNALMLRRFVPIIPILQKLPSDLEKITNALRDDTVALTDATQKLFSVLEETIRTTSALNKTIVSWLELVFGAFPWMRPVGKKTTD